MGLGGALGGAAFTGGDIVTGGVISGDVDSSVLDPLDLFGFQAQEAAEEAAEAQRIAIEQAIEELRGGNTAAIESILGGRSGATRELRGLLERNLGTIDAELPRILGELEPFQTAGLQGLDRFAQGSTPGGFAQNLDTLFSSGALDPLISERERQVGSALAQAGLTRSGTALREAAAIPTDVALQIENMLSSRQGDLAGMGLGASGDLAQLRSGLLGTELGVRERGRTGIADIRLGSGRDVANLEFGAARDIGTQLTGRGAAEASGILGSQQARSASNNQLLQIGSMIAAFLSDMRLKENIQPLAEVNGLLLCKWDWKEGVVEAVPEMADMTIGFLAQDVEMQHPEFIGDFHGFKTIDLPGLMEKLNANPAEL